MTTMRRRSLALAWSLACASPLGCVVAEPFHCEQDEDCISAGGMGRCEPTSYCSYDDAQCGSSRRYSDLAGPLAGACVMPDDGVSSIADDAGSEGDDAAGEDAADDAPAGTGDESSGGEVSEPTDGRLVWSRLVSHPDGGSDRFLAAIRTDDRIVAAGQQRTDLAFVAVDPANGDVVASKVHDVGGPDDAVHAIALGASGEIFACGRTDDDVLGAEAWIGTVDAALSGIPIIASFWGDHTCHVVTALDADRMIAAGDGVPLLPGPEYAWMYAFDRSNTTLGTVHENEGDGSVWHAAAHVDGDLMFGGRLGANAAAGMGVVARLDAGDVPSQFAVFSDALWAVYGLAPDAGGFVLGGIESVGGAPAAWISAHTKAGAERWSWRPGHAEWSMSRIEDVAVDGAGFVVAAGAVSDGADQQRWLVRLDPQGEPLWTYTLPNETTGGRDLASAVVILPDDDIVVVGEAEVAAGQTDAWIARFTTDEDG